MLLHQLSLQALGQIDNIQKLSESVYVTVEGNSTS